MERFKKGLRCQIGSLLLIEKVTTKLLVIEKESFFQLVLNLVLDIMVSYLTVIVFVLEFETPAFLLLNSERFRLVRIDKSQKTAQ